MKFLRHFKITIKFKGFEAKVTCKSNHSPAAGARHLVKPTGSTGFNGDGFLALLPFIISDEFEAKNGDDTKSSTISGELQYKY